MGERPQDEQERVSLLGDEGRQVAANLTRIAVGQLSTEELGPAYFTAPDGTTGIEVDAETWVLFDGPVA